MEKKVQNKKKVNKNAQTDQFKRQYFEYYDDVKSYTHKIVDW